MNVIIEQPGMRVYMINCYFEGIVMNYDEDNDDGDMETVHRLLLMWISLSLSFLPVSSFSFHFFAIKIDQGERLAFVPRHKYVKMGKYVGKERMNSTTSRINLCISKT